MKTKTLSPETEREFNEEIGDVYCSKAGAVVNKNLGVTSRCTIQLKQFIAKVEQRAIEAERERILNLRRKIVEPKSPLDIGGSGNAIRDIGYNMALNDVLEIITEKEL